jgi:cytochrome P450
MRFMDIFFELKQYFQLGQREKDIVRHAAVVNKFVDNVIDAAKKPIADGKVINEKKQEINLIMRFIDQTEKQGAPPTDQELRDFVLTFLLAGRDTTSCALSWIFFELSRHPTVVSKMIEEIETVCGAVENADYSYDNINSLVYTHAVVMEALRLHPPVPEGFKMADGDDVLPDGTAIPKGSCVMYSFYAMNYSEKTWGSDSKKFNPDRFLNLTEPSPFRYPVFNAGPRLCSGKLLAMMEVKLTLAYLLPRFQFKDEKRHDGAYRWAIVMSMKGGFPVRIGKK